MKDPIIYCAIFTDKCRTMQEWSVYWQALGALIAALVGTVGLVKIYQELRRLNEQREKDTYDKETAAKLKRTEFFLAQHRRIFDDKDLYEVLCLIDSDDAKLAETLMWDKKRKLMAFFEEIALLVRSGQIERQVAFYMFGYYSICALHGVNFSVGIDTSREYWALFYEFSGEAAKFLDENKNGPPDTMLL